MLKSNTLSPLTFPESGNTKPRLQPTNGVFTFIHLVFVSSQDFVLSVRVSKPHFSAKYSAYLSIPQHASALSWSRRDT
ncbi:hypothetical protein ELT52_23695 [Escherichia coli]|nr:hypothetical protein [Escherichia coli]EFB1135542.1 hypothetical protein [Escherichia coli]EFB1313371.1 hypothetical protein [Escherichia coli]EFB2075538.1 hypothetical protein [Escherichia coli]EFB3060597.1 hypothetical protein [Escherichia coli]